MSRIRGEVSPMYRRLPHGPNGMRREDVARNQRARLYGATIESVAQRGYQATTVAHVIGLAGVSRRAFYEQFPNKEQCFLATYDIVVARERKNVIDAWQREQGWANRLHGACKTLLDDFADAPKGPRLVLVESLGTGPRAHERMQLAGLAFERLVGAVFRVAPDGVELTPLISRAIVGGVRHIAFTRLLERRERELYTLADEVLDWIGSYRSLAATRLSTLAPAKPPRVPPMPAAFLASDDKRARALGSVVHLTLDEGYSRLTDPQIAQFAGISTEAFHKQFANKQECFLAVLDEFVNEALACVMVRFQKGASWPEGVCRAVSAYVEHLVTHQALVRMAFVDIFQVGPAMISRMMKPVEGFTDLLTETDALPAPAPRRGPAVAREAITGGLWAIISSYVVSGRVTRLPNVIEQLSFVVLAPYLGPKQAVEAIQAARKPLRSA
jgi:AcrR family transcriptional regulator